MFQFKPNISTNFNCIHCNSGSTEVNSTHFLGMHTLAECLCKDCEKGFYHTYPIGHAGDFPVTFDESGKKISFNKKAAVWFAEPLIASCFEGKNMDAIIKKKQFFETKKVVILNCLDDCYGHVLLKLLNTQRHLEKHPTLGLILIIPKTFLWLLPKGIAEVWFVDVPMNKLNYLINGFDAFVKGELEKFDEVYFNKAYTHLDHTKIDLSAFTKTERFDMSQFGELKPTITFALREDKFWLNNGLDDFLFKTCVKFKKIKYLKNYFIWKQNRLVNRVAKLIKNEIGEVDFIATGLGKSGSISEIIIDNRHAQMTNEKEREWSDIYAKSHIIIGVHGSNMLIPTSLAAGFIEILPKHKIPHMAQDMLLSHSSRYAIFLGRHLDEFTNIELIKTHAVSILRDFPFLYKNTEEGK